MEITFRAVLATATDQEFMFQVFTSTRPEMALSGWPAREIENFLRWQFRLQDSQYHQNYPDAAFEVVLVDGGPAGRIYRNRTEKALHLIELTLLPEFRGRGIGGRIFSDLVQEADRSSLLLTLQVEVSNAIEGYYRRLGFVEQEERGGYRWLARLSSSQTAARTTNSAA